MANDALKNCPFCGSGDIFIEPDERGSGGQWVGPLHVGCNCRIGCGAALVVDGTEAEAIAAWNTRAGQRWQPIETELYEALRGAIALLDDCEIAHPLAWDNALSKARPTRPAISEQGGEGR